MNIILVSNKMAKAKTLSIWQSIAIMAMLAVFPVLLTLLFITPEDNIKEQGVKAMLPAHIKSSINSTQMHLDAYAKQIGELQARLMRLDAQNQRLVKLAGGKVKPVNPSDKPAKNAKDTADAAQDTIAPTFKPSLGGPLVNPRPMTELDLQNAISELMLAVDQRDDYLSTLEANVLQNSVLKDMLPNSSPINVAYNSSSYGWRIDPFSGYKAFHEGLDFPANIGTPIHAAADGIVSEAALTPDYGNLVKIEHGSGLETRYAHASKLLVKKGDRVVKGQTIALVGSTGRSTGPHLHYEIRLNGNALDPKQYLHKNLG